MPNLLAFDSTTAIKGVIEKRCCPPCIRRDTQVAMDKLKQGARSMGTKAREPKPNRPVGLYRIESKGRQNRSQAPRRKHYGGNLRWLWIGLPA
jgi:hypothetical protein